MTHRRMPPGLISHGSKKFAGAPISLSSCTDTAAATHGPSLATSGLARSPLRGNSARVEVIMPLRAQAAEHPGDRWPGRWQ